MPSVLTDDSRAYISGNFALELEGLDAGWLTSYEGGMASAEVLNEKVGSEQISYKHLGTPKFEDITITCGTSMSRKFWDWVAGSFGTNYTRLDGALVQADANFKEVLRLEFQQALVTEFTLPACDAASKDAARITVKFSPENTSIQTSGRGRSILSGSTSAIDPMRQKRWLSRNFKLNIDGLNCSSVMKVDALTLKQKVTQHAVGAYNTPLIEPTTVEYPNLSVTMAESHAGDFYTWYNTFILNGGDPQPGKGIHNGELIYFRENLAAGASEAASIRFEGLGLFKLTPSKAEGRAETIRTVKADMFMESMTWSLGDGSGVTGAGR